MKYKVFSEDLDVNPGSLIFCVLGVANKQIFILANMHYRASYTVVNVVTFSEELRGKPEVHHTTNGDVPAELRRDRKTAVMPR